MCVARGRAVTSEVGDMAKSRMKSTGTGTAALVIGAATIWFFTVIAQSLSGLSDLSMGIALIGASVLVLVIVIRAQAAKAPKLTAHDQARTSGDTGCDATPPRQYAAYPGASELS